MKHSWIILVAAFLASGLSAQQAANSTAAPAVALSTNTFNFGRIKQGVVTNHTFLVTNTGNAALEIRDVKPGCGCTTMGAWDKRIEPGQTGKIPLQFNSAGFGGAIHKAATVLCNVPAQTNLTLNIVGEVWRPLEVNPQMVTFTFPSEGQTNQWRTVRIVNNMEEDISLTPPECLNPVFKPELKEIKPGREWELTVTALTPIEGPTQLATVLIRTSSKTVPAINVTAYATIPPLIVASPNQINLPVGPLKTPFSTRIAVRNNTSAAISLSDVAINAPGADAKAEIAPDGKSFNINVTFPAEFLAPEGQSLGLTLKTDHPRVPLIRVPVFQQRPPKPAITSMQQVPNTKPVPAAAPRPSAAPTAAARLSPPTPPSGPAK